MVLKRVVIIDDDPSMRDLIRTLLHREPGFEVVAEAGDGEEGVTVTRATRPDLVLLDLQMPGMDGLAAIPQLRMTVPETRIVVLSAFPDPYTLTDVLRLGVDSYLDKTNAWSELVPALHAVCEVEVDRPA